jgi:hypothetical protein
VNTSDDGTSWDGWETLDIFTIDAPGAACGVATGSGDDECMLTVVSPDEYPFARNYDFEFDSSDCSVTVGSPSDSTVTTQRTPSAATSYKTPWDLQMWISWQTTSTESHWGEGTGWLQAYYDDEVPMQGGTGSGLTTTSVNTNHTGWLAGSSFLSRLYMVFVNPVQ